MPEEKIKKDLSDFKHFIRPHIIKLVQDSLVNNYCNIYKGNNDGKIPSQDYIDYFIMTVIASGAVIKITDRVIEDIFTSIAKKYYQGIFNKFLSDTTFALLGVTVSISYLAEKINKLPTKPFWNDSMFVDIGTSIAAIFLFLVITIRYCIQNKS